MVWPQEGTSIKQEETEGLNLIKDTSVKSRLWGGGGMVVERGGCECIVGIEEI